MIVLAIVAGVLLIAAWLGYAIHVASDKGFNEGLGVLIAWPALVVAAALILLPLVAIFLAIRPRATAPADVRGEDGRGTEPEDAHATETG